MKAEFTAIIEKALEGGYWAICPEIPGANGQGRTVEAAKENLRKAIVLILDDRRADMLRGLPEDAREKVYAHLEAVSVDGQVTEVVRTTIATMGWRMQA